MLTLAKMLLLVLAITATTDAALGSMSGPHLTRDEFVHRLDELGFPWSLATKVGVDPSLAAFDGFEDLKALQDSGGESRRYEVFNVVGYDATGYFSVGVRDFPSIETRDFEMRCTLERLSGYRSSNNTDILFYYGPTDLRVFEVGRYLPLGKPDDLLILARPGVSATCGGN
ncbi:hypothetical protein [Devosia insulae]|nr:hypothetical protein [Devosia insulae]